MLSDGINVLHDNARPHTANLVRDRLQRFGWEILQHPPYIPDLSPSGIFWRLEERHSWTSISFGGGSARLGEVVDPSATYLFLQDGIDRLFSHWDKCINTSGNNFWIKQIPLSLCRGCSIFIWLHLIAIYNTHTHTHTPFIYHTTHTHTHTYIHTGMHKVCSNANPLHCYALRVPRKVDRWR